MLVMPDIKKIVEEAVRGEMKRARLDRVLVQPVIDSLGREALGITLVVQDAKKISGDDALDAVVKTNHALEQRGDHRLAIISFAMESELAANGDPEF